ncbi:O-antigen ligase family protein [Metabacillus fastidiosus]|uniref:O-antigen ligase family protein n=1 Tax=Metabacillus fastidiosus TaxID=1458 RepID=UPI003D266AFC
MDSSLAAKTPKYEYLLFTLFIFITLGNKYNIYIGFALKPYMILLFAFLVIHIYSFCFPKLQLFEIVMLLFYLLYSYTGAFSLYPQSSIRIIFGIILYITCYFIMKSILVHSTIPIIEKLLSNAGIIFNIVSIVLYFTGLKSLGFVFTGDRITEFGVLIDRDYPRLIGLLQDPNFYVFYNTLFFVYYLCNRHSLKNQIGLVLCLITNLLTFSRGGLLVILFLLVMYMLMNNPIRQMKLAAGLIGSLSIIGYFIINKLKFDIFHILSSRANDFLNDGGSGRFELWGRSWEAFSSNFILGIGAFNFSEYNEFHYGDRLTVHNTFLDILSESGLVVISLFCLFIFLVIFEMFQSNIHKHHQYLLLTFIGFIVQMSMLTVIINDIFFLYLAVLATYLYKQPKREGKVHK